MKFEISTVKIVKLKLKLKNDSCNLKMTIEN